MRQLKYLIVIPALFISLIPVVLIRAQGAAETGGKTDGPSDAAVVLVADDVLVFRQIGGLFLSPGQIREIIQPLSTFDRVAQGYRDRENAAGLPVLAPLRRLRAALAAGQTPDAADEAK